MARAVRRGHRDVSTGGDVTTAAVPVAVLTAIGVITGGLGLLRGKRMVLR